MNFNELLETIHLNIKEYKEIENDAFKSNEGRQQDDESMEELRAQLYEEKRWFNWQITEAIENLQKRSISENFYFFDCAFKVYKDHYESRKKEYLENHVDVNEADFIKEELRKRIAPKEERVLVINKSTLQYGYFIKSEERLFNSEKKKREFLEYKLELLGWDAYLMQDNDGIPSFYQFEKNSDYKNPFVETQKKENMKAEEFASYIAQKILEYKEFSSKEGELLAQKRDRVTYGERSKEESKKEREQEERFEAKLINDQKEIKELVKQLYYKSLEDNFYWFDCPKQVYKANFQEIFQVYNKEFLDADLKDFIKFEISKYGNTYNRRFLNFKGEEVDYSSFVDYGDNVFKLSTEKKIKFLQEKLKELNKPKEQNKPIQAKQFTIQNPIFNPKEDELQNKIKWLGKPSQLGYFLGVLASLDYIDSPKKIDGDANYSAFARQILEHFEVKTTEGTLAKYLNIESEKAQEIGRKLNENSFYIPHSKTIS